MKKNIHNYASYKRGLPYCLLLIALICLIASCSYTRMNQTTNTATILRMDPTTTAFPTLVPTVITQTPTRTINPNVDIVLSVHVTQVPPVVSTNVPMGSEYLYKDVEVTVFLANRLNAVAYLNLDNLSDNSTENSDLRIERTEGNELFHWLKPINYAYFFWTEDTNVTFDLCLKKFPIVEKEVSTYMNQGNEFQSRGGSYCVLTNENRIAIVKFITGSNKSSTDFSEQLSFQITVFSEIVTNQ